MSITGFDNVNLAQFCQPALTTVHIPRDEIGRTICESLMNDENALRAHEFVIDPELVLRDSTGLANPRVGRGAQVGRLQPRRSPESDPRRPDDARTAGRLGNVSV